VTSRTLPATAMTEAELLDSILQLASLLKWRTAHFRPARTAAGWRTAVSGDGKGFPDIILARDRLVAIEAKAERGLLSLEQVVWRDALIAAGVEYHLFKPEHWLNGDIQHALTRRV
jgi:hypothetical protein